MNSKGFDASLPERAIALSIYEENGKEDDERNSRPDTLIYDHGHEASASIFFLLVLTSNAGGLQVIWSVILSNGSPYLISLGLSKSLTALVWVAAPLCGVVVQPFVGALSDQSRLRWGRRKPFIVGGAVGTVISMLILAWVDEIVCCLSKACGRDGGGHCMRTLVVLTAVFWVYALNIAIQPLQTGLRALIVENCPAHQQTQASATASCLMGIGNIVGYLAGFTDLPHTLPLNGGTQFQGLCLIASFSLAASVTISCLLVFEKDPRSSSPSLIDASTGNPIRHLIRCVKVLPPNIRKVCHVQFWAWMGWFPFLYYKTTYVAELYAGPIITGNSPTAPEPQHAFDLEAVRIGTFASLLFATVTLAANIILPFFVHPLDKHGRAVSRDISRHPYTSSCIRLPWISLTCAWTCAHVLFALAMFATIFVSSQIGGTILIACVGVSWALMLWAPFAIIGGELASLRQPCRDQDIAGGRSVVVENAWNEDQTGVTMSLHNVAISAPQVLAGLACAAIFWFAKLIESQDGTGWALRAGGCAALRAAWLTRKLVRH